MDEWKKYRKLPVVVRAKEMNAEFAVTTMDGIMSGVAGDFLIEGVEGERYPCKRSVFFATYEALDESE